MARIRNQRTVPAILIAIALLLVAARVVSRWIGPQEPKKAMAGVRWVPLANAETVSRRTGKPILYDFTADWCPPCHLLDEEVFQDPALVAKINEHFVPVRVVDRQREEGRNTPEVLKAQARFGVGGFPTVVFADAQGNVREKIEGYGGAAAFARAMESAR
jgi:thiol:disulfide interchange protein